MTTTAHDLRRFTADEYLRMIRAGILEDDDRVELVGGEILNMAPQGPEHGALADELHLRLAEAYRDTGAYTREQKPLLCGKYSLPEPDLAVVRGKPRDYISEHPKGRDALLVIEIAKTSQQRDRMKAEDYARGEVAVYWLLDLEARRLEQYTGPDSKAGRWRSIVALQPGDTVALPELELSWPVVSLFS